MPVYCYRRPDGSVLERFFFTHLGIPTSILCEDGVLAERSIADEHAPQKPRGGKAAWPLVSKGMGVHPSQIDEAKKRFPDHEFTPEGSAVFNSSQHRKKCLRDVGYVDLDGSDSGRS